MPQYTAVNDGYCLIVRDEQVRYENGRKIVLKPVLKIDFAQYGDASGAIGEGDKPIMQFGQRTIVADIRGGFVDTDMLAQQERWTPEDKKAIEDALHDAATNPYAPAYGDIKLYEHPKPKPPWATYDDQTPAQVLQTAEATGFLSEALLYEQATQKRPEIVDGITRLLTQEEELTAA